MSMSEAKRLPRGGRIRWARARKQLSHDQLAERVNSSRSYLIRVEKGKHTPSLDLIARIAVATEQPVDFFTREVNEPEDEEEADIVRELTNAMRRLIAYETERERVEA